MASFHLLVAIYVLGGITFIPLLLGLVLCHAYLTLPTREHPIAADQRHADNEFGRQEELTHELRNSIQPFDGENPRRHTRDVAAGYFAVCREYVPGGINGKPPERTTPAGAVVAVESPSVYQTMYRSIFDRNKSIVPSFDAGPGQNKRGRNVFYVVLRHGHLMLYDDSEQLEVRHVISLANYAVDVYAGGDIIPEGELWIKRNCIRLLQRFKQGIPVGSKPYYIFSENCSEKEDFYHAILQNQERPADAQLGQPIPLKFDMSDLVSLVQQLHASDENLHTRWINALIGRLFLALYKTADVENFIYAKISKKIARVPKPTFISRIHVQKIDMGNLPPSITNPRLKELSTEGDLIIEADVSYKGNFRLDISAIARIELGTRFKAREVTLILASILKKLDGHVLLRVKPPPSNRLWVTFETPPKMELSLEPIVSTRQITYGVILRAIESRIREVVGETLVFPNWDDIPFSDTLSQDFRGGIWETFGNRSRKPGLEVSQVMKDPFHGELEPDPDGPVSDGDSTPSSEATKGMPTSNRMGTLNSRRLTRSSLDLTDEIVGVSSATDLRLSAKPKAMRSGSFSCVASPVVDVKPANALAPNIEEHGRQNDAVAAMKTTISKSPSTSPTQSPVGSPQQLSAVIRPTSSPSFEAERITQSSFNEDVSGIGLAKQSISSLSQETRLDPISTKPKDDTLSHLSSPQDITRPSGRRPTLNQSFSTATAAAKKWLSPRQNSGSLSSPGTSNHTLALSSSNDLTTSRRNDYDVPASSSPNLAPAESVRHRGPIGRGQPLPPPGTPLPPPPPPEKRSSWSVPAASALANLTRRKPLLAKQPISPRFNDPPDHHRSPEVSADIADHERAEAERQETPRKGSSTSSLSTTAGPPPLPKRRLRLSVTELANHHYEKEEMLVVEAPHQEASAPVSPVVVDDLDQSFASNWNLTDEHEMVFQEMDLSEIPS